MTLGADLRADLRALEVPRAGPLMVHASMRAVGGDAGALLSALLAHLDPDGTLLMVLGADADEPFDAATTPVDVEDMGILAEVFRTWPGARVNDHAAARYAALGPDAAALLEPTVLHDYHGAGSVLERLTRRGGAVLRLGADPDTLTLTHYAEHLARVPEKRRRRVRYVRADIGEQWIEALDDTDGIAEWSEGDYFPCVLRDFLAEGHARVGRVGGARGELLDARSFVDFAIAWLERELA